MKLKQLFKLALIVSIIFCASQASALGRPFRIGFKLGVPNIVTVNTEIVTPLFGNRFGIMADYSDFSITIEDVNASFSYWELGANMYVFSKGRGPYLNFSYLNMKTDLSYDNIVSDINPDLDGGIAETQVKLESFSLKLGAKLGGLFYFRPEIGYLFTPLQREIDIDVTFPDGSTENQVEEIPSALGGSLIFNIGFGFAF